ncbi:hypothetical protein C8R44DRAFT_867482 [Mycena epipterygia]|nr:hypothetical protein C8R44DRAFT_867482 [Mycena epipterygia]
MAHTLSTMLSAGIQALLRLVQLLFGRHVVKDVEAGGRTSTEVTTVHLEDEKAMKEPVSTYKPKLEGLPALTLASMSVSAALIPNAPILFKSPTIVVTPPPNDLTSLLEVHLKDTKVVGRRPLQAVTNSPRRVHGQTPPRKCHDNANKENLRDHPNAPRRPKFPSLASSPRPKDEDKIALGPLLPRVQPVSPVETLKAAEPGSSEWEQEKTRHFKEARAWSIALEDRRRRSLLTPPPSLKAAEPGSSEWEEEKAMCLKEARAWSDTVKDRRRHSFPTPPPPSPSPVPSAQLVRRVSAPARIPLQERLRRAVSDAVPVVKVAPLWGDENVSFVVDDNDDDNNAEEQGVCIVPASEARTIPEGAHDTPAVSPSPSLTSSSMSSISSLLDAFDADLTSPAWLGLQSLANLEEGRLARAQEDQWSEVLSLEDYV